MSSNSHPNLAIARWALLALSLFCACSSPKSGTQTGDEGDVLTPSGACPGTCPTGQTCCNKTCVAPDNDNMNCGMCNNACGTGKYCKSKTCIPIPCSATCAGAVGCCGSACCAASELCCDEGQASGPVCTAPGLNGSCPSF